MTTQHIKDSTNYHFSAEPVKADHSLAIAIAIALSSHALLIFGISFTSGQSPASLAQDVATAMTQKMEENKDANFIANASQEGGGDNEDKHRLESAQISPLNDEQVQQTQDIINQQKQIRQKRYQQSYLSTTLSYRKEEEENDNESKNEQNNLQEQEDRIRKEIATLEAQLSQQQQVLSSKTKIETVDSNSTTFNKTSGYLENFRKHVENLANQHYPAQALSRNITGDVRLMVIIKSDGNVKAIRLLESSGSQVLDEAAKQSVRQSAPYGKFTKEMDDIVELRIIRTWRYSGNISVNY